MVCDYQAKNFISLIKRYEEGAIIESTPWPTHNIDMDFRKRTHANDTYIKYWRYVEPTRYAEAVQKIRVY